MRTIVKTCDRCGKPAGPGSITVQVPTSSTPTNARAYSVDLCIACWLKIAPPVEKEPTK